MNFYYNLRKIINILDCTNIELANASKLDQTIISKFKNNIRIPTIGSKPFNYLIQGICILANDKNKTKQIKDLCGNSNSLYNSVYNYLLKNSIDIRLNKEFDSLIGTNLNKIMKTFNVSNVMLAKFLNKDGSLISKYKTGKRYVLKNDILAIKICEYFEKYIIKNNLQEAAYALFNVSNTSNIKESVFDYLFTIQKDNMQINSLLESINDFKIEISQSIPPIESLVCNDIIYSNNNYYIGTNGFRDVIKKFLCKVCLNRTPTTMYLYSDENMNWLLKNKAFYNTWKMLMINCLIRKNRIRIIHNIERNPNEMIKAIESWLPLYMTGLIEPYYNLKSNNNFTHTLFIAESISVINSSSIISNEDCNIYNYSENKKIISNYKKQYVKLLKSSKSLTKIYTGNSLIEKLKDKNMYHEYFLQNLENIIVMLKNDETEALILKNSKEKILFEFTYPKMINIIKIYINEME